MIKQFKALYTKHKTQKRKTWNDGIVKFNLVNRKASIYDADGKFLDSTFCNKELQAGDSIESDMFLVEVEDEIVEDGAPVQAQSTDSSASNSSNIPPKARGGKPLVLRRKPLHPNPTNKPADIPVRATHASGPDRFQTGVAHSTNTNNSAATRAASHTTLEQDILAKLLEDGLLSPNDVPDLYHDDNTSDMHQAENTSTYIKRSNAESMYNIEASSESTSASLQQMHSYYENMAAKRARPQEQPSENRTMVGAFGTARRVKTVPVADDLVESMLHQLADTTPNKRRKLNESDEPAKSHLQTTGTTPPIIQQPPKLHKPPHSAFVPQRAVISKASGWNHSILCFPDKNTCYSLYSDRTKLLPNQFKDSYEYREKFAEALREEINLHILEIAKQFHDCFESIPKTDGNLVKAHQQTFRQRKVNLYLQTDIKKGLFQYSFTKVGQNAKNSTPLYICISPEDKGSYKQYAKGDIWVISSTSSFNPQVIGDVLFLAKSVVHGPNSSGQLEVEVLDQDASKIREQTMHCINCGNFSTELAMLENLQNISDDDLPIMRALLGHFKVNEPNGLGPPKIQLPKNYPVANTIFGSLRIPKRVVDSVKDDILSTYRLNEDQQAVLEYCANWLLYPTDPTISPILLVHGVFGSVLDKVKDTETRILISSSTNVAVDRILLGLVELNFTNFMRIGSLKKIAKALLKYTIYRDEDDSGRKSKRSDSKACQEIEEMLRFAVGTERFDLEQMLNDIKNSRGIAEKMEKLKSVRVVGVTCAASIFPILDNHRFPIVILDECSQMIEPLSMLPINRFGCERLLLVGDPLQLPPQLTTNAEPGKATATGLSRTIFSRMVDLGLTPIMLRTQYRLHPLLCSIVNNLFYSNKIIDGVTAEQRSPLLSGLPTLIFYDTKATTEEKRDFVTQSYYNPFETDFIVRLLKTLISRGIRGSSIGVICLYKAQELRIMASIQPGIAKAIEKRNTTNVGRKSKKEATLVETEASEESGDSSGEDEDLIDEDLELASVQISTVDAFQGAEREIIIVSCSRTTTIGFTDFANRVNVALTRAKRHLFVVGHADCLSKSNLWEYVIKTAYRLGCLISAASVFEDPIDGIHSVNKPASTPTIIKQELTATVVSNTQSEMLNENAEQ